MTKQFSKYTLIGILNTLIHWLVFFVFYTLFSSSQSLSNLLGFAVAVVFSFFMNAKFTFQTQANIRRFISFTLFMAIVSWLVGYIADIIALPPLLTLIAFSGISLVLGFLYAKIIVFEDKK